MPQVIAPIAAALVSVGFSTALATAVATFSVVIGATAALSAVSSLLTKKPRVSRSPIATEYSGTIEYARVIYGKMRVSGMNVIPPWSSGANGDFMHQVLVLAGRRCHAITDVYAGQTTIASASITAVTGTANDGKVTSGDYANILWVRRFLGSNSQTVDFILNSAFPSQWTTDHRLRDYAYLALQYKYSDLYTKQGKPDIACLAEGALVYDPRLDSTNGGSGSHRYNDVNTWQYSNCPALIVADFLMWRRDLGGYGVDPTRIDWALVAAAANICDENVLIPPASPTTTQKRYTCNCVLELSEESRPANLAVLVGAMLGVAYESGGKWRIYAGAWSSAAFAITEADITVAVSGSSAIDVREQYNAVSGTFVDAERNYTPQPFSPRTNATYQTEDGVALPVFREVSFAACTNEYEAQRAAMILNRLGRRRKSITPVGGLSLLKIRPYETGTITLPEWNLAALGVRAQRVKPDLNGIEVELRDEASTDWSDPAVGDYGTQVVGTGPTSAPYKPPAPTSLTITALPQALQFVVGLPSNLPPGAMVEIWEHTASTPFASASKIGESSSSIVYVGKRDTTIRYYWARIRTPWYAVSDTFPAVTGSSGAADLIQTTDVTTDGMTDVYDTTVSSTDVYTSGSTPIEVGNVAVSSYPYETEQVVTANGIIDHNAASGSQGPTYADITDFSTSSTIGAGDTVIARNQSTSLLRTHQTYTIVKRYTVPASTAKTYRLYGQGMSLSAPGSSCLMLANRLKVEVIKR